MNAQQFLFRDQTRWCWRHLSGTSSARFSPCHRYRYELRRTWDVTRRPLVVVACNPSSATDLVDDPTTRRLYAFADRWGLGGVVLFNIFALRSTDPAALRSTIKAGGDAIGAENDDTLRAAFETHRTDKLLLAWGGHGETLDRGRFVASLAVSIHGRPECFGLTQGGHPRHPLYVPDITVPQLYTRCLAERAEAGRPQRSEGSP